MSRILQTTIALALAATAYGCAGEAPPSEDDVSASVETREGVFDFMARGLNFEAPDEIPSGWITFRFNNESGMVHFAQIERMPEGIGAQEQQEEVAPVFQEGYDLMVAGDADAAMAKFGELPEWFGNVVFVGGPGLTAPGLTSQATVYLEPGTYLLECWVKTDDVFHSYNPDPEEWGMVHQFTVTADGSGAAQPAPAIRLALSSESGISMQGDPRPGTQTFMVHFDDQVVHENFLGHDVHLARIDENTDLDALNAWMDWTAPDGLETPAPVTFIGGLNQMSAGADGYFTATLEPGRYALVAEVTNPAEKGMLLTFTVPEASGD